MKQNGSLLVIACLVAALCQPALGGSPFKYDLDVGDEVVYVVRIEVQSPAGVEYLGGVVHFRGREGGNRALRATAHDNLRRAKSAARLPFVFPTRSHWLKEEYSVPERGRPLMRVKGELPMLMGNLDELFFPPLPIQGDSRTVRRDVHDLGGGDFRPIGTPSNVPRNKLGKFIWTTQLTSDSGISRRYLQKRHLQTHSGRYQLNAEGIFQVDASKRRMTSNSLRGTCVFDGQPGEFTVQIKSLSKHQMRQLMAGGR